MPKLEAISTQGQTLPILTENLDYHPQKKLHNRIHIQEVVIKETQVKELSNLIIHYLIDKVNSKSVLTQDQLIHQDTAHETFLGK